MAEAINGPFSARVDEATPMTLLGEVSERAVAPHGCGNKPHFVDVSAVHTYSVIAYTGAGGGSRHRWFQVWDQ